MILMGRASRDPEAWQRRVALAEAIGARVMTDRKAGAVFPTDHPLHAAGPGRRCRRPAPSWSRRPM